MAEYQTSSLGWAGKEGRGESTYAHTYRGLGTHRHYDTVSYQYPVSAKNTSESAIHVCVTVFKCIAHCWLCNWFWLKGEVEELRMYIVWMITMQMWHKRQEEFTATYIQWHFLILQYTGLTSCNTIFFDNLFGSYSWKLRWHTPSHCVLKRKRGCCC